MSEAVPTTPPADALMVALPTPVGEASPEVLIVVTLVELELHAAVLVISCMVPSEKVAEARNCCAWPVDRDNVALLGVMVITAIVLAVTVIGAVAVTLLLLDFADSVALPSARPVTLPELSTDAILPGEVVQISWLVTSPVVLFPNVAVAVNCWLA